MYSLKDAPEGFIVGSPGEMAQSGSASSFLLKLRGSGGGSGGGKRSRSVSGSASTAGVGSGGGMEVRIRFSVAWRRDVRLDYCLEFKVRGSGLVKQARERRAAGWLPGCPPRQAAP